MSDAASTAVQEQIHRIFTATLVLGIPGSGKTSLFGGFSEYLWETYKKVLLLYSWDGGAIPTDVQKRMRQGLIRFWRARTRSGGGLGLETMYLASKGYWPAKINPQTGETTPAVTLVPPVTVRYHVTCPQGHALQTVPAIALVQPLFCTPCGKFISQPELKVREEATRTKGFEMVGGVGFDGLTSMGGVVLDHMDLQRGEGLIGGEKSAFGGVVQSGGYKFGGNNRADVGFGQTRAHQFVMNSLSIPHLVEGPVWTALAMEATDEGGLPIVGAKLPGRAATDEASAWFGNVFETAKTPDDQGRTCFTIYLRPFVDPQGRRHLLKTSASPTGLPPLLRDPAEDLHQPYSVVNLGSVFRMLDEDLKRALLQPLEGAPGMDSGEYGDAFTIEQTANVGPQVAGPVVLQPLAGAVGIPVMQAPAKIQSPPVTPPAAAPPPAQPAPPAQTTAPVHPSTPAPAGPPIMQAPTPRRRQNQGAPTVLPVAGAPAAPAPPAAVSAPPPSVQPPVANGVVPAAVAPTGTAAPPPVGMRPPMRAPGS